MNSVLGLYLSPREGGNSDLLLDEFLRGCKEAGAAVQTVTARKLEIEGCIECGGCDETGECILRDDMDEVYPLLLGPKKMTFMSAVMALSQTRHSVLILVEHQPPQSPNRPSQDAKARPAW